MLKLNCLRIGDPPERTFPVKIEEEETHGDFRDVIKEKKKPEFDHLPADSIYLSLVSIPFDDIEASLQDVNGIPEVPLLRPLDKLKVYFPNPPKDDHIHILIKTPAADEPARYPITVLPPPPEIVFSVPSKGDFGGLTGVQNNDIQDATGSTHLPEFLNAFQNLLGRQRIIKDGENCLAKHLRNLLGDRFSVYFEEENVAVDSDTPTRTASEPELDHFIAALSSRTSAASINIFGMPSGKQRFISYYLTEIAEYLRGVVSGGHYGFGTSWRFPLVATIHSSGENFSYTPHSDFHFCIDGIPYMIWEIVSDPSYESDRYRMLLQAACVVRLWNSLPTRHTRPFVAMSIYVNSRLEVERYLLYQPEPGKRLVNYVIRKFNFQLPSDIFALLFELYNFAFLARLHHNDLNDPQSHVSQLKINVEKNHYPRFTTKSSKRKRTNRNDPGDDENPPVSGPTTASNCVYDYPSVQRLLFSAGFQVVRDRVIPGWKPLNPLKPTLSRAKRLSNGAPMILKHLDNDSDELSILKHLNSVESSFNHTIPLCGEVQFHMGSIIAIPAALPVFAAKFDTVVDDLMQQFLEGVAFIHQQLVAHLDLKPDNLVVAMEKPTPRLFIIDFDVAVVVKSIDSSILGFRGTPSWAAPEVGDAQPYSPIRADRWSCGRVLSYFAEHHSGQRNSPLMILAEQLLNRDPFHRPPLDRLPPVQGVKRRSSNDRLPQKQMRLRPSPLPAPIKPTPEVDCYLTHQTPPASKMHFHGPLSSMA